MKYVYKTITLDIEEAYQFKDGGGTFEGGSSTICRVTTPYGKIYCRTKAEALVAAQAQVDSRISVQ
jgi:hypothetical protein